MQIAIAAYAILLTSTLSAFAVEPKSGNNSEGAKLYLEYCSMCHGEKGQGIPSLPLGAVSLIPPAPPLSGGAVTTKSRSQMVDYIRNGGAGRGGVMEGFHDALTGAQIDSIIDWIVAFWPERDAKLWREKDKAAVR